MCAAGAAATWGTSGIAGCCSGGPGQAAGVGMGNSPPAGRCQVTNHTVSPHHLFGQHRCMLSPQHVERNVSEVHVCACGYEWADGVLAW